MIKGKKSAFGPNSGEKSKMVFLYGKQCPIKLGTTSIELVSFGIIGSGSAYLLLDLL